MPNLMQVLKLWEVLILKCCDGSHGRRRNMGEHVLAILRNPKSKVLCQALSTSFKRFGRSQGSGADPPAAPCQQTSPSLRLPGETRLARGDQGDGRGRCRRVTARLSWWSLGWFVVWADDIILLQVFNQHRWGSSSQSHAWMSRGLPAEPSRVTSMDCDFLMDEQPLPAPYR